MVGKAETVLQEVVEQEREIHLDYYLRDTFLHFGKPGRIFRYLIKSKWVL